MKEPWGKAKDLVDLIGRLGEVILDEDKERVMCEVESLGKEIGSIFDGTERETRSVSERIEETKKRARELEAERFILERIQEASENRISFSSTNVNWEKCQETAVCKNENGEIKLALLKVGAPLHASLPAEGYVAVAIDLIENAPGELAYNLYAEERLSQENEEAAIKAVENFLKGTTHKRARVQNQTKAVSVNEQVAEKVLGLKIFRATQGNRAMRGGCTVGHSAWIDTGELYKDTFGPKPGALIPVVESIPNYEGDMNEAFKVARAFEGTDLEREFNQAIAADGLSIAKLTASDICLAALKTVEKAGKAPEKSSGQNVRFEFE